MKTQATQAAFTLIELLVVLAILSLIAGLVGPTLIRQLAGAKADVAALQIGDLSAGLDLFFLDNGRYPRQSEGLDALVKPVAGLESWDGPYMKKPIIPNDPWGQPYRYEFPGQHGAYDLYSFGADNAPGGAKDNADVVSWQ